MNPYAIDRSAYTMGDIISDAANAVYGAASSVVQAIPGLRDVVNGPLADLVNGPLKDFANTTVGQVCLRAVATYFTGGLATVVGPQVATMCFALPGVLKGDDFEKAWYDEFSGRCSQLIGMAGQGGTPPAQLATETSTGAHVLSENFPPGEATWNLRDLANNAQIRDEAAAWALSFYNHQALPDLTKFDAQGHYLGVIVTNQSRAALATNAVNAAVRAAAANAVRSTVFNGSKDMNTTVALAKLAATTTPSAPFARANATIVATAFQKAAAAAGKPIVKATGAPVKPKAAASSVSTPVIVAGGLGVLGLAFALLRKKKKR